MQDLEDAGAFVLSLDARRSWFRYHRLFADLLQAGTVHELLAGFPAEAAAADAELRPRRRPVSWPRGRWRPRGGT